MVDHPLVQSFPAEINTPPPKKKTQANAGYNQESTAHQTLSVSHHLGCAQQHWSFPETVRADEVITVNLTSQLNTSKHTEVNAGELNGFTAWNEDDRAAARRRLDTLSQCHIFFSKHV